MLPKRRNTSGLVKKRDSNTKATKIENIIRSATGLVTTAALNTNNTLTENKTPDITKILPTKYPRKNALFM